MIIEKINKSFDNKKIIKDFSLDIPQSSIVCLIGPSGCGKTTLLNMVAGLIEPDSGRISFDGKVSYLFQEPRLLGWRSALENVALVTEGDVEKAALLLKKVGLENDMAKKPAEMSGGMRQRVAIARAFAFKSDVILMDEPFQNLDIELKSSLLKTFLEMWKEDRRTVLWVTHDVAEAALVAHRIVCVGKDGMNVKFSDICGIPQSRRTISNTAELQSRILQKISC